MDGRNVQWVVRGNPLSIHSIINSFGTKWPNIRIYICSWEVAKDLIYWSDIWTKLGKWESKGSGKEACGRYCWSGHKVCGDLYVSRVCTIRKYLKTGGESGLVSRYEPDSALGHSTSCSTGSRTEGAMVMWKEAVYQPHILGFLCQGWYSYCFCWMPDLQTTLINAEY